MTVWWSGLWVEVEVLDNERIPTPVLVKDLGRCLTVYLLLLCFARSSRSV